MCLSIPHLAGGWGGGVVDGLKNLTDTPMTWLLLHNNNNNLVKDKEMEKILKYQKLTLEICECECKNYCCLDYS